jgi:hypothetical protein
MYFENLINNWDVTVTYKLLGLALAFCSALPFLMMKAKIAACLMICCNLQLAIGDWIHNKLQWRWQNSCWNVVGTQETMK